MPMRRFFALEHLGPARLSAYVTRIEHSPAFPEPTTKLNTHPGLSPQSNPVNLQILSKSTAPNLPFVSANLRYRLLNAVFVSFTNKLDHSLPQLVHWSLITVLNSLMPHSTSTANPPLFATRLAKLERPGSLLNVDLRYSFLLSKSSQPPSCLYVNSAPTVNPASPSPSPITTHPHPTPSKPSPPSSTKETTALSPNHTATPVRRHRHEILHLTPSNPSPKFEHNPRNDGCPSKPACST